MYRGLSHAAWGYFFLNFDFNLGTVSIFPRFAGYLLFLSAIGKLRGERRDLALLRPLCVLLAVWSFVDWTFSWAGEDLDGRVLFLDLLAAAAGLYFHFQFLTDMASLAEVHQAEGGDLHRRLLRHRSVYVVLMTVVALLSWMQKMLPETVLAAAMVILAVICLIAAFMVMANLFELRRCFRDGAPKNE